MSAPQDDQLPLERLVSRLDLQPWLTRRVGAPNRQLALGSSFLRGLGLPALLHVPALFVMGLFQTVVGTGWARAVNDAVVYGLLPVAEALCAVVLALCFHRRRADGTLTAATREQSRFLGFVLAVLSGFGNGTGLWEPLAVSALAVVTMLLPSPVPATQDGRPWWAQ
ncbi:MAG: hypothetical protein ACXVFV_05495 [Mycobacteriales bacterium]